MSICAAAILRISHIAAIFSAASAPFGSVSRYARQVVRIDPCYRHNTDPRIYDEIGLIARNIAMCNRTQLDLPQFGMTHLSTYRT